VSEYSFVVGYVAGVLGASLAILAVYLLTRAYRK